MMPLTVLLCISYLLGSIPTSVIVGKLFYGKDIRTLGSGNAGGTNTFRVFGWKAGLFVSFFDVGKGAAAALLFPRLISVPDFPFQALMFVAGLAAVMGHVFPLFAGFRGGKGVATAAGVLAALLPFPFLFTLSVFALVLTSTGYVSLASLSCALTFPFFALAFSYLCPGTVPSYLVWTAWVVAAFIFVTHRKNIGRLLRGTENRFERIMVLRRLFRRR